MTEPTGEPAFAPPHVFAPPTVAAPGSSYPALTAAPGSSYPSPVAAPGSSYPPFVGPYPGGGGQAHGPTASGPLPPARPPRPRRRDPRVLSVAWVVPLVVLALVAGLVGGYLGARLATGDRLPDAGLPAVPSAAPSRPASSVAGIAAAVLPSVALIEATTADGVSTGSGFVLRADGYLLTNAHVVDGADGGIVTVTLADGREQVGRVVGTTAEYDLAVVKIDVDGLTPLLLGDSDAVAVGDPVVAVGAPLGLAGTVTEGIVSATHRPVHAGESEDAFIDAIQTDAAINPGNSGGPLVGGDGAVVGITSAIATPPGTTAQQAGNIGLGFAIPSNQARRTATQLIETGRATYPVIGVLLDRQYVGEGVRVLRESDAGEPVRVGGPADRAGIRPGDVILSIDGRPVTQSDELVVAIRARTPGDTVVLHVRSGTSERDVSVVLDEASPH